MKSAVVVLALVALIGSVTASCDTYVKCSANEVMQATPPCCEPTCDCDCLQAMPCQQSLVYQPTCVCVKGYVRYNGQCVEKSCCPAPSPYSVPYEATPYAQPYVTTMAPYVYPQAPVYEQPSCGCGQTPCQCAQSQYVAPTYEQPSCGCGQTPCQCAQSQYVAPTYEQPSCGCGQTPCQCAQPVYPPAPVYTPAPVYNAPVYTPAPVYNAPVYTPAPVYAPAPVYTAAPVYPPAPSCGCGYTPCGCAQPAYPTPMPYETTMQPYTSAPPTCSACEQLVFTQPCCEPTCDNDCSNVNCSPLLLVQEPTCACRPGLVRYQGHCVERSACPSSASRFRLYVPKAVSCACNSPCASKVVVY
ncbi:adhesive plaque matrix protein-like [Anopheles nili]|uniref:adhesive plaque matrix protein-like n=1 Tax=Anopheles nili TaxID=185578 RepID=UPI00237AF4F3|nr:adhesive plaque matrix protein-like [Anopheles nili]